MKPAPTLVTDKLRMMKASSNCLIFGLLGLLPIIGAPFALAALWYAGQAKPLEKRFWNPAKPHRLFGVASAAIGMLIWGALDIFLIIRAVNAYVSA
jgi:hypothetical protein